MSYGCPWMDASQTRVKAGTGLVPIFQNDDIACLIIHSVSVPLPRHRLHGCACTSPLAHFYIHHSGTSVRELHPFTTTTHLASQNAITDSASDDIEIEFLFRKRGTTTITQKSETKSRFFPSIIRRLRRRTPNVQWTNKLAGFAQDVDTSKDSLCTAGIPNAARIHLGGLPISLRLEGPYFTPADPYRYETVICIVAGTGISGALAIAGTFKELERQSLPSAALVEEVASVSGSVIMSSEVGGKSSSTTSQSKEHIWKRCIILWSVREEHYIDLPELKSKS